ncbi:MAG: hypothetical protein Q8Q31_01660 [Nanoarchaeota archaeon]|nr:hypothetical protein [Nanoarchaeota archaeon]
MALFEILFGMSILLFIILIALVLVFAFRPPKELPHRRLAVKSDLEKIKAQIG